MAFLLNHVLTSLSLLPVSSVLLPVPSVLCGVFCGALLETVLSYPRKSPSCSVYWDLEGPQQEKLPGGAFQNQLSAASRLGTERSTLQDGARAVVWVGQNVEHRFLKCDKSCSSSILPLVTQTGNPTSQ